MNKDIKRSIYLILLAIILFSATMSVPILYNSRWEQPAQGGAAGLFLAGIMTAIASIIRARKEAKK